MFVSPPYEHSSYKQNKIHNSNNNKDSNNDNTNDSHPRISTWSATGCCRTSTPGRRPSWPLGSQRSTANPRTKHRKEPVRFDSFWFRTFRKFIGSVQFGQLFAPVRRGSVCLFRTRRGSVRFGLVRFRVRFRPVPKLKASVRFGSVRPVRFGFLCLPAN